MPRSPRLTLHIEENQSKKCSVNGCPRARHKLSAHCSLHAMRKQHWGHPVAGKAWKVTHINGYLDQAQSFVSRQRDHKGVVAAIEWLDAMLATAHKQANEPKARGPIERSFRHLSTFGITGEQLLVRCVAVLFYIDDQLTPEEMEGEVVRRNMGRFCMHAAPKIAPSPATCRKYSASFGRAVWGRLSKLFMHVLVYQRTARQEREAMTASFKEPFANE